MAIINRNVNHPNYKLGCGNSSELKMVIIVRGIMVETFKSRIKTSNLVEMFILNYLLIRNMAPLENRFLIILIDP